MVRLFNYFFIVWFFILPFLVKIENGFLQFAASLVLCIMVISFLDAMTFEDNLMTLGFMVCFPFILYITSLPTANANLGIFLGTIFLAVALPLVTMFLLFQLAEPLEG